MTAKILQNAWQWRYAMLVVPMALAACGDSVKKKNDAAITTMKEYYKTHELPRSWTLDDITAPQDGKLLVDLVVESSDDVVQIKSRSRMLQFFIAKQGCPKPADDSLKDIDKNYRVWVRLWSAKKEELTNSICPQLYGQGAQN